MSRLLSLVSSLFISTTCQAGDPAMVDMELDRQLRDARRTDPSDREVWSIDLQPEGAGGAVAEGLARGVVCIGGACTWASLELRSSGAAVLQIMATPTLAGLDVLVYVPSTRQFFVGQT